MIEKERFKAQYGQVTYDSPEFQRIKRKYDQELGRKQEKESNLSHAKELKELSKERLSNAEKALKLVDKVARQTQEKLQYHISNLVSMAQASVFDDPYKFEVEFVQRASKTECDLWFTKNKERLEPMLSSGGGALDIASFALRCAFWSLQSLSGKRTRPIIILDEPFRFVSVDLQSRCAEMIKQISSKLKIQIIMVSHLPNIIDTADKVFRVVQEKGRSEVIIENDR